MFWNFSSVQWECLSLTGVKCRRNIHDRGVWISLTRDYTLASFDLAQIASLLADHFMACEEGDGKMARGGPWGSITSLELYWEGPFTTYQPHEHRWACHFEPVPSPLNSPYTHLIRWGNHKEITLAKYKAKQPSRGRCSIRVIIIISVSSIPWLLFTCCDVKVALSESVHQRENSIPEKLRNKKIWLSFEILLAKSLWNQNGAR